MFKIKALANFFNKFKLNQQKEELETVVINVDNGVVFRGTNLWILLFAIFVASPGLIVNSTAVITGAMLISPLMGPIPGIGPGIGINDVALIKKAIYNYSIATGAALAISTLFFLIFPLSDAHSEIPARISPTIYDVLIALFGGFAGISATYSKQRGNVIPGAAIATALTPPLCTTGYGLATLQFNFFRGAFYLFIINTVFIASATFILVRVFDFPYKGIQNKQTAKVTRRIIRPVVIATLIPGIYFGYDMVEQNKFVKNANRFIAGEAHFPNDYLPSKKIDSKIKKITLVFGGKEIAQEETEKLRMEPDKYNLHSAALEIKQGFAYLPENRNTERDEQLNQLTQALVTEEKQNKALQLQLGSISNQKTTYNHLYAEIKAPYPMVKDAIIQQSVILNGSAGNRRTPLALLTVSGGLVPYEKAKSENWLKERADQANIYLIIQQ